MSNKKITEDTTTTAPAKDAPALVKKIGRTTYIVRVYFSKTSKETMSDKIKRILLFVKLDNAFIVTLNVAIWC